MQQKDVLILLGLLREVVHYWKELRILYPTTILNTEKLEHFLSENDDNIINNNTNSQGRNIAV